MCFLYMLTFKEWLDALQLIATAFLGIAAYLIARRQYRTAHNKLRLDLFEKRYAIYQAFVAYINQATNSPEDMNYTSPIEHHFYIKKSEAVFLMPSVVKYLEEYQKKVGDLRVLNVNISRRQGDPKYSDWVDEEMKLRGEVYSQLSKSEEIFRPYLEFPEKRV
jgi:LPS O-antigen subunit length determinant protein (WzzB/FepE family)